MHLNPFGRFPAQRLGPARVVALSLAGLRCDTLGVSKQPEATHSHCLLDSVVPFVARVDDPTASGRVCEEPRCRCLSPRQHAHHRLQLSRLSPLDGGRVLESFLQLSPQTFRTSICGCNWKPLLFSEKNFKSVDFEVVLRCRRAAVRDEEGRREGEGRARMLSKASQARW